MPSPSRHQDSRVWNIAAIAQRHAPRRFVHEAHDGPWHGFPNGAFLMGVRRFLFQLVLWYNILQHFPSYAIILYIYRHQNILVLKCLSVFSHVWTKNNKNIKPQFWYIQVTCFLVPKTVCTFVDGQWLTTSLTITFDVGSASEVSIICLDLGTHVQLTYSMMSPMGKTQLPCVFSVFGSKVNKF